MLKQIKNISGVSQLSKKEQQKLKAGFNVWVGGYICPGGSVPAIVLLGDATCPIHHLYLHPQGVNLCCASEWAPTFGE